MELRLHPGLDWLSGRPDTVPVGQYLVGAGQHNRLFSFSVHIIGRSGADFFVLVQSWLHPEGLYQLSLH